MLNIDVRQSTFMPGDYSLYLSFSYNERILNIIRSFKDRSWHKESKEWEVPVDKLSDILEIFSDQDIQISGTYLDLSPKEEITDIDFEFKTEPFEHQKEGFLYGLNHDKWLLGDEMGLGKSKQAIDIAVALKQSRGYKHCLIVCGVNGLKWNWKNEVAEHSDESAYILGQKTKKKTGEIYIGSNKDKLKDVENLENINDYFIITNIESLRDKNIVQALQDKIHHGLIQMTVLDEAHKAIKENPNSSQQGKGLMKINTEYKLPMTGTPLMNSPLDVYGVLRWLGVEKHAFYTFKKYYAIMGGYGGYEVIGYNHLDELQEDLDSIMLRRLKDDVLDLPEKIYIDEYVDMLAKQSLIYKEVKAEIKANIDMIEISPNPLAEMIRLRQATGYTGILSSEIQCSAKLDRMEEIIEDSISNGRKVIVFSNWTQITDEVHLRLHTKYPLSVITGQTADSERQANVDAFQRGESVIMLGTIGAMGTGITLTEGTVVIFLDHPWNKALYEQAVDRAYRIGQKNNITIYNIMCKNTIDERVWELVNRKGRMSDAIVDGKFNCDKKDLVNYLLS